MSYVIASPDAFSAASSNLSKINSALQSAKSAAAGSTTQVTAEAGDEVSTAISQLFGNYGQEFQALSAQASQFHEEFVQALTSGGLNYAASEAANANPLATLDSLAFSPVKDITGRPLFGNGTNGAAGTGANGGAGGWIIGNGGNGGSGVAGTAANPNGGNGGSGGAAGLIG